jgi:hypothetical protein
MGNEYREGFIGHPFHSRHPEEQLLGSIRVLTESTRAAGCLVAAEDDVRYRNVLLFLVIGPPLTPVFEQRAPRPERQSPPQASWKALTIR